MNTPPVKAPCGCIFWTEGETKDTSAFFLRACPQGEACEYVKYALENARKLGQAIAIARSL